MLIIRPSLEDLFMEYDKSSKLEYTPPDKKVESGDKKFYEVLLEVNNASWKQKYVDNNEE